MTALTLALVASTIGPVAVAVPAAAVPVAAAAAAGGFSPLAPARLADTRAGGVTVDGGNSGGGPVVPSSPLLVQVTGRGGVASSAVAAVALNVTVTSATSPGYVTVYPNGSARPLASNLNFAANQTIANTVVAAVGSGGRVAIYSSAASAQLVVDVSGYFTTGGGYTALTPARIADSRAGATTTDGLFAGTGPLSSSTTLDVQVTGRGGVDALNVTAVVLNVTVTASTTNGYFTVYPTGASRPTASNLNFATGQTVANAVVAKVGTGGKVTVYNSGAAAHAVVDVAGFFTTGSGYVPLTPARFGDTRSNGSAVAGPAYATTRTSTRVGPIGSHVANGTQIDVLISGRGGVPLRDTGAVVLNVTATDASTGGFVTVFPLDTERPLASNLNHPAKQPVPNLVIAKLGRGGGVSLYASGRATHVIVDVLGYFPGVDTADAAGQWSAIGRDELGMPLSYDRCYPIPYRINRAGEQSGWFNDVQAAVGMLEVATGLDFVYLGTTTQAPTTNPGNLDTLLVGFTDLQTLGAGYPPGVIGLGGSAYTGSAYVIPAPPVRWMPTQFVVGFAYFDADTVMPSGFGTDLAFGQVALHELAHAVGLGHVANLDELMNSFVIDRAGGFGPGDLFGLSLLHKTQACPGSPATHGTLRGAAGKPVPPGAELQVVTSADHDHDHD